MNFALGLGNSTFFKYVSRDGFFHVPDDSQLDIL